MKLTLTLDQMIERAATVACIAHDGQVRKDQTPYIQHPIRVAIKVEGKLAGAVALLHDVVEDTDWTLEDLVNEGFSEEVIEAVEALTKRPGEKYADFITRIIKAGELAIRVKLADIEDNTSDTSALEPDEAEFLAKRYAEAKKRLEEALELA